MHDRSFTPATARQALDGLRPLAETLCRLYRRLERACPARIVTDQPVDAAYFLLVARLYAALTEIRRRGVWVDDLRAGRLVFPARRAGRRVMLSWQVGEPTLGFWRDPRDAATGRRPLDEDGPWEEG